jgi:hypothetical protein
MDVRTDQGKDSGNWLVLGALLGALALLALVLLSLILFGARGHFMVVNSHVVITYKVGKKMKVRSKVGTYEDIV